MDKYCPINGDILLALCFFLCLLHFLTICSKKNNYPSRKSIFKNWNFKVIKRLRCEAIFFEKNATFTLIFSYNGCQSRKPEQKTARLVYTVTLNLNNH